MTSNRLMEKDDKNLQCRAEELIEWLALNRERVAATSVALLLVVFASQYLWTAAQTLGSVPVGGTVSCDGSPIRYGTVTLLPVDGRPLTTTIRPDGSYYFPHTPAGRFRVAVSSPNPQSVFLRQPSYKPRTIPQQHSQINGGRQHQKSFDSKSRPAEYTGASTVSMPITAEIPLTAPPTEQQKDWFPIPGHYANPMTSSLSVTAGTSQQQDLVLKTPQEKDARLQNDRRE